MRRTSTRRGLTLRIFSSSTNTDSFLPARVPSSVLSLWQPRQSLLSCADAGSNHRPSSKHSQNDRPTTLRVLTPIVWPECSAERIIYPFASTGCVSFPDSWALRNSSFISARWISSSSNGCSSSISSSVNVPFQNARLIG